MKILYGYNREAAGRHTRNILSVIPLKVKDFLKEKKMFMVIGWHIPGISQDGRTVKFWYTSTQEEVKKNYITLHYRIESLEFIGKKRKGKGNQHCECWKGGATVDIIVFVFVLVGFYILHE